MKTVAVAVVLESTRIIKIISKFVQTMGRLKQRTDKCHKPINFVLSKSVIWSVRQGFLNKFLVGSSTFST